MFTSLMSKKYIPVVFMSILISTSVFAEVTTRDALIANVKAAIPDEVCKQALKNPDIAKAQTDHGITLDSCKQKIMPISDNCFNKYKNLLPASLNSENPKDLDLVKKTMGDVGNCVAADYVNQLK